jgi:hypothetical protein
VCILEQNYATTQMLPTSACEQAALSTYAELMDAMTGLCGWLNRAGYRAQGDDQEGESIFIHYGVAAGLGQLGLNGQLLTPQAGSRCRLGVIYTDAPLEFDSPVDYGLEGICDRTGTTGLRPSAARLTIDSAIRRPRPALQALYPGAGGRAHHHVDSCALRRSAVRTASAPSIARS